VNTSEGNFRYLTAGEILSSQMIFGDAIDYSMVRIYNKKWMPMQKNDVVMSPNGNIYYPSGLFREDFSTGGPDDFGLKLFIHEMTHVWQHQRGYSVKLNGILSFSQSRYRYELGADKRLSDYNMEQQANILADYFLILKFGGFGSAHLFEHKYKFEGPDTLLPLYRAVLADFISNPRDDNNLPGRRRNQRDGRRNSQPWLKRSQ